MYQLWSKNLVNQMEEGDEESGESGKRDPEDFGGGLGTIPLV